MIYDELCRGRIEAASRDAYRTIIADLVARGAQAVILGCTEIGLLVGDDDAAVPLFDTARRTEAACSPPITAILAVGHPKINLGS